MAAKKKPTRRTPTARPKRKTTRAEDATAKHTRTKERQAPKAETIPGAGETAQPTRVPRRRPVDAPKVTPAKRARKQDRGRAVHGDFGARIDEEPVSGTPANALLRVTDSLAGTVHDEAKRLKIRQTDATFPVDVVKVEGEKVLVGARPEQLAPEHMPAHKRDTRIKDDLRDSGDPELVRAADGVGGDWHEHTARYEADEERRTS